jgi:hypothetical protein
VSRGLGDVYKRQLFGHGRAANQVPTLEYTDPQTGPRQVAGADEAVVTGADDERIEIGGRGLATG